MKDTPRTDEWETYCDEWYYHLWRLRRKNERGFNDGFHINNGDEAKGLCDLLNNLETELTEVTEDRDRLLEEREQWSLSSAFKEIDMMGIRYAAAEMHHANNMKEVTEQRDEALSDLEFRRDLYSLQTKQLDDVREQRDRLAEALERILDYKGRFAEEEPESIAREALKSLIPNK